MQTKIGITVYLLIASLSRLDLLWFRRAKPNQSPKPSPITGCLQRGDEANEFAITREDGKKYELTSKQVGLKDHVGPQSDSDRHAQARRDDEDERESKGGWAGQVQVSSLKMISSSCG